jgi:hypothetical protein
MNLRIIRLLRLTTDTRYVGWIPVVLSQIISPMEEMAFQFYDFPGDLEQLHWSALADVIERPAFYRLKRIQILVGSAWVDNARLWIRTRLPRCYAH